MRRELLQHAVILSERHLRPLLAEYVAYYNDDRTHLGLDKQTPSKRRRSMQRCIAAVVIARARVGGLHHRYDLAA